MWPAQYLFTVPSRYSFTIDHSRLFSEEGGSSLYFKQVDFTLPVGINIVKMGLSSCGASIQEACCLFYWYFAFLISLTTTFRIFFNFFPQATKMFQFAWCFYICFSARKCATTPFSGWVPSFSRYLGIHFITLFF